MALLVGAAQHKGVDTGYWKVLHNSDCWMSDLLTGSEVAWDTEIGNQARFLSPPGGASQVSKSLSKKTSILLNRSVTSQ